MDTLIQWIIISTLVFYMFNIALFEFGSRVLYKGKRKKSIHRIYGIINTGILLVLNMADIPKQVLYFGVILILAVEFWMISGAKIRQVLFLVTVIMLHIEVVFMLTLFAFANAIKVEPIEFYYVGTYYMMTICSTLLVLSFIYYIVHKLVPFGYMKIVSKRPILAEIMSALVGIMTLAIYINFHIETNMQLGVIRLTQVYIASIAATISFYFLMSMIHRHLGHRISSRKENWEPMIVNEGFTRNIEPIQLYTKDFMQQKLDGLCHDDDVEFGLIYTNLTFDKTVSEGYVAKVASIVQESIRTYDFPARMKKDAFLVLLEGANEHVLSKLSKKIKKKIDLLNQMECNTFQVYVGTVMIHSDKKKPSSNELLQITEKIQALAKLNRK